MHIYLTEVGAIILDISFADATEWQVSAQCLFLLNEQADIWCINVTENLHLLKSFAAVLHPDEVARANRYLRKEDHDRFIISRGSLRYILSKYIHARPDKLVFQLEPNRKPYIAENPVYYNLSDSGGQVLIVVSNTPVGIDVEYIKPKFYYDSILPLNFNQAEIDFISESDSSHRFFILWTRKEAILKATGIGLTDHLKEIPALDGKHILDGNIISTTGNWSLWSFLTSEDYIATVATGNTAGTYNLYNFNHQEFLF